MFVADVQHPPRREVFASEEVALACAADHARRYGNGVVVRELGDREDVA